MKSSCIVVTLLPIAAEAFAQSVPAIEWIAPPDCPMPNTFVADLGSMAVDSIDPATSIAVTISQTSTAWQSTVHIVSSSMGTVDRSIDGESCEGVVRATRVILALALGATPAEPPSPSSPDIARAPPVDEVAATLASSTPTSATGSPSSTDHVGIDGRLAARLELGSNVFPSAAVGFGAEGALTVSAFQARLALVYWLSQRVPLEPNTGKGGDFDQISARAAGCYLLEGSMVFGRGCLGVDLGFLSATGFGIMQPRSALSIRPAISLGVHFGLHRRDWLLGPWLGLEGDWALSDSRFTIDGLGTVYEPPALSFRLVAGVELVL